MSKGWRAARDVAFVAVVLWLLFSWHEGKLAGLPSAPPAKGSSLGKVVAPVPGGRVTSGFGNRQASGVVSASHYGTDIAAPAGTPIRAIADGTVIVAGEASGFGHWIQVKHRDGTVSVYGHMYSIPAGIRPGVKVGAGQRIAGVGADGQATGPHLHIEIWPGGDRARHTDPEPWFRAYRASITTEAA